MENVTTGEIFAVYAVVTIVVFGFAAFLLGKNS